MMDDSRYTQQSQRAIYTVSTLNLAIRDQLEGQFFHCLVEGEISNAAFPQSGHIYFNLKDENSVMKAVIWRSQALMYRALIMSGQKVRVTGKITVYAPRGEYQLIVSKVEEAGKGDLYVQFEALKKMLQQEGLFNAEFKQEIPKHPTKIGIVTSKSAAALQDVLNVLQSHRPDIPVILYETLVQGENAGEDIVRAIKRANREEQCDLLLLVRGGGSIEDLWAFNEEVVARAIFASRIPIISGVGHETDTTIADYVADLRAPTPSMAAKYSSQSRDELLQYLQEIEIKLMTAIGRRLQNAEQKLVVLQNRLLLKEPKLQLVKSHNQLVLLKERLREVLKVKLIRYQTIANDLAKRLDSRYLTQSIQEKEQVLIQLGHRLEQAMLLKQKSRENQFIATLEKLHLLSPLNVLLRGYSVVTDQKGSVVKSITQVNPGDTLDLQVADGNILVKVEKTAL
ncbi:exodeoxyribonuclease VII large subunit [Ignatzschineria sp. LJL83]